MTRSIDGIRMWINSFEPERGRTLEHANEEVRTLLSALDAEKARADAAEVRLKEALASVERRHMEWDTRAWSLVERELRARHLTVCSVVPGDGESRADAYSPVWEGEAQDGWSLVAAVDGVAKVEGGGDE